MAAPIKRAGLWDGVDNPVPTKQSRPEVSESRLEKFLQWCMDNKFELSPKVCVEQERSCAQYGMVAVEDIPAGEVLFSVPRPLLLLPDTCEIAELLKKGHTDLCGNSDTGWVPLILALLYEYNNPQSLWRPYLDLVPDFSELDLPMFWNSNEREDMLSGTSVVESVDRDLSLMEKDFSTKALPFMQKYSDVFSPQCQSFDLYKKMVAFIMAYSFTEPRAKQTGKGSETSVKDEEDDDDVEEAGSSPPMMVPMADILNHVADNNASLTFDVDVLRMVTTRDIKKGEEVFNTYGELANSHLLHMYGFAQQYPFNHYDTVDIPMSVVAEVAEEIGDDTKLTAAKLLFLQEQELLQEEGCFVLGKEGVLTDDEMHGVLKVLAMPASQFKEHAENEGWSDAENDDDDGGSSLTFGKILRLPEKEKHILSRCAEVCLESIAHDEQEDSVSMKTDTSRLSPRERYSLYVRYGQRQLLRQLIEVCQ